MGEVSKSDYVELELLNQRLSELQQSIEFARQQLDHSAVALEMLSELEKVSEGQEILVPIGSGTFITVNSKDVKNVKLSVGAGVVVEKSTKEATEFILFQRNKVEDFLLQSEDIYDKSANKALKLQEEIEAKMRSN